MRKKVKYILSLLAGLLVLSSQPVWAAGPPEPSPFSNPLAITLIALMTLLLIIIGVLANILIGTADIRLKKKKAMNQSAMAAVIITGLMFFGSAVMAQGTPAPAEAAPASSGVIGGLSSSTFYILISVIFLELFIILALLINIKFLIKAEREKAATVAGVVKAKKTWNWWNAINKFRPIEQEADMDLGHDYDGIRELDNRLPPWWLYGFYVTIIFAGIYLWRFHVSHTAPSSREEFETSVARADAKIQEYLKAKGDAVDENNVVMLSGDDLDAGKKIFQEPGLCNTCHGMDGSGMVNGNPGVGPNLTDANWIHGGSIKNIFTTIKYGVDGKGMPEWKSRFSAKQLAQLASYVKSLKGTNPAVHKGPDGPLYVDETPAAAKDSTGVKKDTVKIIGK